MRHLQRLLWWLSALAVALTADAVAAERSLNPARLANLVRHDCGSCHGLTLNGGLGKALTADQLAAWSSDELARIILDGIAGTPMPPWRPLLTEAEARWIADALKKGYLP